jgi:hypothetical protein
MDPCVTLLEVNKLMYLAQEAGEPLKLRYTKGLYGPYAKNLRHVLNQIEGYYINGYADAEDTPDKPLEINCKAAQEAAEFLKSHRMTRQRFERVANLVEGYETPFGMELLTTVHWVIMHDGADSLQTAIEKTHAWNPRKQMFSDRQIASAWNALIDKNWLTTKAGLFPEQRAFL